MSVVEILRDQIAAIVEVRIPRFEEDAAEARRALAIALDQIEMNRTMVAEIESAIKKLAEGV